MSLALQIIANLVLYGFLIWQAYEALVVEWDPWFGFVVVFMLLVAIVTSIIPGIRAPRTTPGTYPFDD